LFSESLNFGAVKSVRKDIGNVQIGINITKNKRTKLFFLVKGLTVLSGQNGLLCACPEVPLHYVMHRYCLPELRL